MDNLHCTRIIVNVMCHNSHLVISLEAYIYQGKYTVWKRLRETWVIIIPLQLMLQPGYDDEDNQAHTSWGKRLDSGESAPYLRLFVFMTATFPKFKLFEWNHHKANPLVATKKILRSHSFFGTTLAFPRNTFCVTLLPSDPYTGTVSVLVQSSYNALSV